MSSANFSSYFGIILDIIEVAWAPSRVNTLRREHDAGCPTAFLHDSVFASRDFISAVFFYAASRIFFRQFLLRPRWREVSSHHMAKGMFDVFLFFVFRKTTVGWTR